MSGVKAPEAASLVKSSRRKHEPPLSTKAWASNPFQLKTSQGTRPEAQQLYDTLAEMNGYAGEDSLKWIKKNNYTGYSQCQSSNTG